MINKKEKYVLMFFILLIYIFNSGSIAQLDVYHQYYIPLADSILNDFSYSINGNSVSYPMWGYSILLSLVKLFGSYNYIIGFQLVLCYFSILSFYRLFQLNYKNIHLVLLLPIISLSTVKWNDAIVGSLLIFYIEYLCKAYKSGVVKNFIISGLLLGIILNFRSEYLLLIPIQIVSVLVFKSVRSNVSFIKHCVIYLTTFLILLPWALRNKSEFDELKFTSSNGAAVMYISLGQLPDNKWGIKPIDESAFNFVNKNKIKDPYSIDGEKILKSEFIDLVIKEPIEYAKKCGYNLLNIFIGGIYTGEYGSLLITRKERIRIDNKINSSKGIEKFNTILKEDYQSNVLILLEKIILISYRLLWLFLISYFMYLIFMKNYDELTIIIMVLVIFKLLTVSMIQYEYRHINSVYPFVLGIVLRKVVKKV
jgi:hypothetical protein